MKSETLGTAVATPDDELIALHRLALLGGMLGMVAHEFNNLMTPVFARAKDALERGDEPTMRRALEITLRQTERAGKITERLLHLAHGGEPHAVRCELAPVVAQALASAGVRPFERDAIEVDLLMADDLAVHADPLLLEHVLLNLLLNARRAMRGRGGPLRIAARPEDGQVVIDVRDSGSGLSDWRAARTINSFLAADANSDPRDWHVVGLGLNVCRRIVQQHGGSMEMLANEGPGCTVRLRWPTPPA
jgi:signal transduction histidine kinase